MSFSSFVLLETWKGWGEHDFGKFIDYKPEKEIWAQGKKKMCAKLWRCPHCSWHLEFDLGACSFQWSLCTWYNSPNNTKKDDFDWLRHSGETKSHWTGPDTDRNGDKNGRLHIVLQTHQLLIEYNVWLLKDKYLITWN